MGFVPPSNFLPIRFPILIDLFLLRVFDLEQPLLRVKLRRGLVVDTVDNTKIVFVSFAAISVTTGTIIAYEQDLPHKKE